ncbi:Syncytin-A [Merluccius polli]|uniref:Syncytin-A n=1 Tax=Merluccius polli TaxID=89951 RepID=A0AA47N961_MERPO|nr:Syncytin-A [Merluccius polli]
MTRKNAEPRGIPSIYKARNEVASGFEANIPIIGLLKATSAVVWQNRQALDWLLVEKGGVCELIGEMCCTFIPNNTSPNGTFTLAMNKLKKLRQEVKNNAGHGNDWMSWLELRMGKWGTILAQIGLVLLIVFTMMGLVFCCCIPVLRSMIESRLNKQMFLMTKGIVEEKGVEWEYIGNKSQSA